MNKETNKILIYSSSATANATSNSAYTVTLSNTITRIKHVEITNVCIPFLWYNVNTGNSDICAVAGYYDLFMTSGTYTTSQSVLDDFNGNGQSLVTLSITGNKFKLTSLTAAVISIDPQTHKGAATLGFVGAQSGTTLTAQISTVKMTPFVFTEDNRQVYLVVDGTTVGTTLIQGFYTYTTFATELQRAFQYPDTQIGGNTVAWSSVYYEYSVNSFYINIMFNQPFTTGTLILSTDSVMGPENAITVFINTIPGTTEFAGYLNPPSRMTPKVIYLRSHAISSIMNSPPDNYIIHKIVIPQITTRRAKYSDLVIVPDKELVNGVPGRIISDSAEYQIPLIAAKKQSLRTIDFQLLNEDFGQLILMDNVYWSLSVVITTE